MFSLHLLRFLGLAFVRWFFLISLFEPLLGKKSHNFQKFCEFTESQKQTSKGSNEFYHWSILKDITSFNSWFAKCQWLLQKKTIHFLGFETYEDVIFKITLIENYITFRGEIFICFTRNEASTFSVSGETPLGYFVCIH